MCTETLKNKVAIVGAADTEVGVVPHLSATQLYVKAAKFAVDDAKPFVAFYGGLAQYHPYFEAHGFGP